MDSEDVKKMEKIKSDRKDAHASFSKKSPVYRAFTELEKKPLPMELYQKWTKNSSQSVFP